jgi:hypothetical protein
MGIQILATELASEQAWRIYCSKNPAAETRLKLKADLGRYLSKVATLDASSGLTIDGLRYLKSFEKLQSEKCK